MTSAQVDRERSGDRCEDLRATASSEIARDQADDDDDEPHLDRRQKARRGRRQPEQCHGRGREQRRQRRLVDVAERRVPAGDDVVHLVAVEAVGAGDREETGHHQAGDEQHRPRDPHESAAGRVVGRGRHRLSSCRGPATVAVEARRAPGWEESASV
jgi:hypothetical protein